MKKNYLLLFSSLLLAAATQAQIHVATTGSDENSGTAASPYLTIHKAVSVVSPGDTIWVHGGTYRISERIKIPEKATSADKRIYLWAVQGEEVVIDGSDMNHTNQSDFKMGRCIYLNHLANYWHFKGLTLCHAEDNGMKIEGSYNIIEHCTFHDNNDTGLQIGMYKDFTIEETKELPSGTPQFNPGYQYCRGNIVINCDSYNNCDLRTYNGTDDGGDADGFACKLFPGPGTEFHNCRAWVNSDDNWDLYMVYHPVVIDGCWSWKAGYKPDLTAIGNGNGFKLGGGGTSGGAAFSQSVGAHVVTRCVAFDCLHKGFDQNNAYEGMYILNCTAWGNEYNYRFPTVFQYGSMYIRNSVGFAATKLNHEFLSADKAGAVVPDTEYNSWTTLDGCDAYKDGNKVGGTKVYAKDYSNEFQSLSSADFLADRQADGSLPDNGFARLKEGSTLVDCGQIIADFEPTRFMTEAQASAAGIELATAAPITIAYNDAAPDFGAFESGTSTMATLRLYAGTRSQLIYKGSTITPVTFIWGQMATGVVTEQMPATMQTIVDSVSKSITLRGTALADATIYFKTVGGANVVTDSVVIRVTEKAPATLRCLTDNASQQVVCDSAITDIRFRMGGGATSMTIDDLPQGLLANQPDDSTLVISGTPSADGTYIVTAKGGMEDITCSGTITRVIPTRVLTGDWYHFTDSINTLPSDLQGVIAMVQGSNADYQSYIDPVKTESGTIPSGCTAGAVIMGRSGGGIQWTLPMGVVELKANLHFTGGRTFKIAWTLADGTTGSTTTEKISKGTYCNWDVLAHAGLDSIKQACTISLTNEVSSGEVRMYDMYARVYARTTDVVSGMGTTPALEPTVYFYQTETAFIAQGADVRSIALYDINGRMVRSSQMSQVCSTEGLEKGVYILKILLKDGQKLANKYLLR